MKRFRRATPGRRTLREVVVPTVTWTVTAAVISWTVSHIAYLVLDVHYPEGVPALMARWAPLVVPLLIAPMTTAPRVILQRRLRETNERLTTEIERRTVLQAELEYQASHDVLTTVLNRRGFFERAAVEAQAGAAVVVLDLDGFKAVNDTRGHATGDAVLLALASALKAETDGRDALVGRLGGDEFVVLLPAPHLQVAESIRKRLTPLTVGLPDGTTLTISVSLGVSVLADDVSIDAALAAGDRRMYAHKRRTVRQGRHRVPGPAVTPAGR